MNPDYLLLKVYTFEFKEEMTQEGLVLTYWVQLIPGLASGRGRITVPFDSDTQFSLDDSVEVTDLVWDGFPGYTVSLKYKLVSKPNVIKLVVI